MRKFLTVVAVMAAGGVQAQSAMPKGIQVVEVSSCQVADAAMGPPKPIECTFTNYSQTPVATIQYALRVSEKGRTIPWSEDGFPGSPPRRFKVEGGLEPGETTSRWLTSKGPSDDRANLDAIRIEAVVLAAFDVNGDLIEE